VISAYEKGKAINTKPTIDEESRKILFGQSAATVRR
jgi:GST-like protein